jgi:hypothetical protein
MVGARRVGPQHRPPPAARALFALLGLGAIMFAAALMLSDRAPSMLRRAFGDTAHRLWERIDASDRAALPTSADLPETDFFVHVLVWSLVVALVAMAVWTWRGLAVAATGVFASSVVIELAQGRLSDTRSVESNDVLANALGVGIGVGTVAGLFLLWSAVAAAVHTLWGRR